MVTAAIILRDHHPIRLFGAVSLLFFLISCTGALLRLLNYLDLTSLPNEVLTGTIIIFSPLAIVSLSIGLILSAVNTRFRELNQIMGRRNKYND
jgi:ABC-type polysaccharide/polyol phosphate export permease